MNKSTAGDLVRQRLDKGAVYREVGVKQVCEAGEPRGDGQSSAGWTALAVVEVVRVEWIGSDALNVVYRSNDGPAEVLLYREAEPRLELIRSESEPNLKTRWGKSGQAALRASASP